MINIAIFGSGNGTNFEAIIKAIKEKKILNCKVIFMHSNNPQAFIIKRAKKFNIKSYVFDNLNISKQTYDDKLLNIILENKIDLICLAGYMSILSKYFLSKLDKKILIINIHPSLLPKYPGLNSIERAYNAGEEYLGATTHFVDIGIDTGQIILQAKIARSNSLKETELAIHQLEYKLYLDTLNLIIKNWKN